jgi:hypothetical protein
MSITEALVGIILALVVITILMLIVHWIWPIQGGRSGMSNWGSRKANYQRRLTPDERRIIRRLVGEIAPRVQGTPFTRMDLEAMLNIPRLDPVIYFNFQRLLSTGYVSEDRLIASLSASPSPFVSSP